VRRESEQGYDALKRKQVEERQKKEQYRDVVNLQEKEIRELTSRNQEMERERMQLQARPVHVAVPEMPDLPRISEEQRRSRDRATISGMRPIL
jgi:hypothetical protein